MIKTIFKTWYLFFCPFFPSGSIYSHILFIKMAYVDPVLKFSLKISYKYFLCCHFCGVFHLLDIWVALGCWCCNCKDVVKSLCTYMIIFFG